MPSFLGLRFPATDIPPIARKLYAETPIRVISDVNGVDTAVLAASDRPALDMSLALLRGKDKVHQKYLQNMGVNATLTVPVVVDGLLWGLFASHHRTAMAPDPSDLAAAELAGKNPPRATLTMTSPASRAWRPTSAGLRPSKL